jgi:sulfur-oxidizing protein SoxX
MRNLGTLLQATVWAAVVSILPAAMTQAQAEGMPAIAKSLTGKPGNVENGIKLSVNRKKGNCLACHVISSQKKHLFHGEIGPELDGVASRYSEAEIRQRIADAKTWNPDTIMPSFLKKEGLYDVNKGFENKSMLSPQDVEDILAFMMTLK